MSGRVYFDKSPPERFGLYENEDFINKNGFSDSLKTIQDNSVLSKTFFSKRNIDCIQNKLIRKVFEKSGHKIARQSDLQLQIIMRSIYLQYSKNLSCDIKIQIKELNKKVLDYSLDRVITEILQFLEYKNTVTNIPSPLIHPQNLSSSGEKSLSTFRPI
jgi:hypothetical protein